MKFYLLDNDITTVKILENIIKEKKLGVVIGHSTKADGSVIDILIKKPDIVLIDFIIDGEDGITIINEVKGSNKDIRFIIISMNTSMDLISKAYNSGIEFFIKKPINIIEVTKVIEKVSEKIHMDRTLKKIKGLFHTMDYNHDNGNANADTRIQNVRIILTKLGILGEKGGRDILQICDYLIKKGQKELNTSILGICHILDDNPKAMQQRIRRTVNRALINMASLGIEDYLHDNFINYSNRFFNFKDIKAEMDHIRGKRTTGGKIDVKKFINGILSQSEL